MTISISLFYIISDIRKSYFFMDTFNSSNGSDACEFTSGYPLSTWLTALQVIILTLSFFSSLLLNIAFAIIVVMYKSLHQREIMICLTLAISNICYTFVAEVSRIAAVINGGWPLGKQFCLAIGTVTLFLALLRYIILLAITVDRFGSLVYPFRYPRHSTKVAAAILIIGSLYVAIVVLGYNANIVGCYNFDQSSQICTLRLSSGCSEIWCRVYGTFQLFTLLVFGVAVPLILNTVIFYKAKKHRQAIADCGKSGTVGGTEMVAMDLRSLHTRAIITMALLILSIVVLTVPHIVRLMLDSRGASHSQPVSIMAIFIADLYLLIPAADGLAVWRNRDVKERAMMLWKRLCNFCQ